jgi:hypothetical protein
MPSPLCADMTHLASAKMFLCGPGKSATPIELTAALGAATRMTVDCTHVWSATTGEAQAVGEYRLWAVGVTTEQVAVQSDPLVFSIIQDYEVER